MYIMSDQNAGMPEQMIKLVQGIYQKSSTSSTTTSIWTDTIGNDELDKGLITMEVFHSYPLQSNGWHQELIMMII